MVEVSVSILRCTVKIRVLCTNQTGGVDISIVCCVIIVNITL